MAAGRRSEGDKLTLSSATPRAHKSAMDRKSSESGLRAVALAAALLAITFNFLQPLAHAALMRDGGPSTLWSVFCKSTAADPDAQSGTVPMAAASHECCLGLAHSTPLTPPPTGFVTLEPISAFAALPSRVETPTATGIRDGPTQPRGPPSLV